MANEVSQRQPGRDGDPPGEAREDADRERAEEQAADDRRDDPRDDEELSLPVGERETADADRDQRRGRDRGVARRPRSRWAAREREHDREAGRRPARPPGSRGCAEDGEECRRRDQPPGKAEPVDAMVDCRLECRREHEPRRKPDCRPDEGGDRPDDGAVRQQHESQLLLGGTDRGEHAEMAQPPLCDDCEARSGDEGGKEQEDGGHGEHREHGRLRVVAPGDLGTREGRWGVRPTPEEGLERLVGRVDEDAHVVRGARGRGRDERELVAQLARVLDDPHDRPPLTVERQGRADVELQKRRPRRP